MALDAIAYDRGGIPGLPEVMLVYIRGLGV